jgi:hypothetical protein
MTHVQFVSFLFELEMNLHIAHLQTQSFAEHSALAVWDEIGDFRDGYAELLQKDSILTGYSTPVVREVTGTIIVKNAISITQRYRTTLTESNLQNEIDTLLTLLETTLYKLKFLK